MRPRNLARIREARAAADETRHGDAVVRSAKRPHPIDRPARRQLAQQAPHLRHLQGFAKVQRRQDAGQAARKHRLARAWRAAHQHVMTARRGELEGPPRLLLPVHLGEVVLG